MRLATATILGSTMMAVAVLTGCADPAADKPKAVVDDAKPDDGLAANGDRYVIGEGSSIGFVGSKVTGSHDGGFHEFDGEILMVDGDPSRSSVKVVIDASSIWADHEKLTGHLKSADFFGVEAYPTATFESTSVESNGDGTYTITGNLDLHGVTKSIAFPATIEMEGHRVIAQAEFAIKRFDWNIVYKGKADDLIRDDVVIKLDLVAQPAV